MKCTSAMETFGANPFLRKFYIFLFQNLLINIIGKQNVSFFFLYLIKDFKNANISSQSMSRQTNKNSLLETILILITVKSYNNHTI